MSEQCTPRPGEIWRYECPMIGDRVGVVGATGRATMIDGDNRIPVDARPVELIGYTAGFVALRGFGPEGDWSKLSRELHAAEAELAVEREKVRSPGLVDVARDEPWRVLRAAADLARRVGQPHDANVLVRLADEYEREHAEKAKRDRLIEEAEATLTRIISGNVIDGYPRNAAASILAEFPGVINALADARRGDRR